MYTPEQNFYVILNAYCNMWEISLSGDDISTLQILWRETEHWFSERRKKTMKTKGKPSPNKSAPRTHKPSRARR